MPTTPLATYRLALAAVLLFLLSACNGRQGQSEHDFETALGQLDDCVDSAAVYRAAHQRQLSLLQHRLEDAHTAVDSLQAFEALAGAYAFYQSDTALDYAATGIAIAQRIDNRPAAVRLAVRQALVLGMAGLPWAGHEALAAIDGTHCSADDRLLVLRAYVDVSDYYYSYFLPKDVAASEIARLAPYRDSLLAHEASVEQQLLRLSPTNRSMEQVLAELKQVLARSRTEGERGTYAIIISNKCQQMNDQTQRDYYWALSAIHFVRAARMDNEGLIRLAQLLVSKGEWRRAERYARLAAWQADFYKSRSRQLELYSVLQAISAHSTRQNRLLTGGLILAAIVILGCGLKMWRDRRCGQLRAEVRQRSAEAAMRRLRELEADNERYARRTERLGESSKRFLGIGIDAIFELGHLRQTVVRKLRAGEAVQVLKLLQSGAQQMDGNQKRLLQRFDIAFTHLYPDWCERINALLQPECRIELPESELMNNELRLLALLRLGITDCQRMATILDIAVNTIYFYRNRLKNRALHRDRFEQEVLAIDEG